MRRLLAFSAVVALAGCATPEAATTQESAEEAQSVEAEQATNSPEVLERDAEGRATKVRLEGQVYDVCTPGRTDGCINPRDAGLDEGNREIDYWPGKPASEIDGPLPVSKPDGEDAASD